ncbi:MAG: hypothetical protein JW830_04830 [Bacteroidales bacterium]|nr:hypothetical protein [Bacteroidales bacterium]
MKRFALSLISLLYFISLFSQAPQSFRYQTAVRNNLGELLADKPVGLKISILKNSPTGTLVFSETFNLITNSLGLINLSVGTGSPIYGSIVDIDWGAGEYYLRIDVDRNGGSNYEFLGTSQLQSVPYALYAEKAGSGEVQSELYWKRNGDNLYYNDGYIGIGTEFPDFKLHIAENNNKVVIGYQPAYDGPFINLYSSTTDLAAMLAFGVAKIDYEKNGNTLALQDWAYLYGNNLNAGISILPDMQYAPQGLYIKRGGLIGIGTSSPTAKLEIADGDIYIKDVDKGIIMTSPNGQCWRGTINNSGVLQFAAIPCP